MWWSRGNYGLAEEAFLHLAAKHKGGIFMLRNLKVIVTSHKILYQYYIDEIYFMHCFKGTRLALYLNELGRLHLYQDDPDIAVSYFKEAESILHSASRETNDAITVQTLILCANAYDQGYVC